jgi:hypothetical protein
VAVVVAVRQVPVQERMAVVVAVQDMAVVAVGNPVLL